MPLRNRFNLLLIALCLALAAGLVRLRIYENREFREMLGQAKQQRLELLDRLIALRGLSLKQFADDYSLWDETVAFLAQDRPDPAWSAVNLEPSLGNFDVQIAWVLKPDGSLFHRVGPEPGAAGPLPSPLAEPAMLEQLRREKRLHFYLQTQGAVIEIRGAVVTASDDTDRLRPAAGFIFAGRIWGADHLADLGALTNARPSLSLDLHVHADASSRREPNIHLHHLLRDWHGEPLAVLQVDYDISEVIRLSELDAWESVIFFFYGALAIVLVVFFTRRWVLQPLDRISTGLSSGDLTAVQPLLGQNSELGRVARLMQRAAQDRQALQATIEERARLGRDLHDGVIQTLYASGMNLASARAMLAQDPVAAAELLEQTRNELNAIIRDMRNFITRLEPVGSEQETFAAALHNLSEFMQAVQPARYQISIDEPLAAGLPMATRTQLLHVAREAVSNALRHGAATEVRITLIRRGPQVEFAITDNGRGFDPAVGSPHGRGLDNLAERARELSGSLDIQSQPGQGTALTLRFTPTS